MWIILLLSISVYTVESGLQDVCVTKECVLAAAKMLASIDEKVDPCKNFFAFACGGWEKSHVMPEDKSSSGIFDELIDEVDIKLKAILEEPIITGEWEAIKKAKNFYLSCLNTNLLEKRNLNDIMITINELGGWPVMSSSWSESSFNLEDILITTRKYTNSPPIFNMYVYIDSKNPNDRVFYIDQQEFGMPDRDYFLKGRDDETLLAYETYATQFAVMFGANSMRAKNEMKDVVDFEIRLANISLPGANRRDDTKMYNLQRLHELITKYDRIDWMKYFNAILNMNNLNIPVTSAEPIINRNPEYFRQLSSILNITPKRTIANYIVWRYVMRMTTVLPERIREIELQYIKTLEGTAQIEPRLKTCVSYTNLHFGLAVGNLFLHKYFEQEAKLDVENMIDKLKYAMKELITGNNWMDSMTQKLAKEKLDKIAPKIGYPDEVDHESKVNKEYELIIIKDAELYDNYLSVLFSKFIKELIELREPVDKEKWDIGPVTVNAFYDPNKNQILFPAGILQPPFYQKNVSDYLNYGGIGTAIGHEITHGFDDSGRHYDKDGKLHQWWTQTAINNFESKAECIEKQYSNYTVKIAKLNLNGKLTLGENIADNGGIRESFKTECGLMRPEEAIRLITVDPHSDFQSRVLGPLQNFDEFSKAFNCAAGSPMNPISKCVVW